MLASDNVSLKEIKEALTDLNKCEAPKDKKENVKNRLLGIATGFVMASQVKENHESDGDKEAQA